MFKSKEEVQAIIDKRNENVKKAITLIDSIIDAVNCKDQKSINLVMKFIRNYFNTSDFNEFSYIQIEKYFKIKKVYPDSQTNVEQWILSKICK